MLMRILLGSGGFRTPERVAILSAEMPRFFGDIDRLLFIPYALADHDGYVRILNEKGIHAGYRLDGIHTHADPIQAVREAPAIFIGGGNTFRLLNDLYRLNLLEPVRERIRAGIPYLGISAGSNVAGPTIRTTNDMPIVQPPSLDALGLVPFQINPHYFMGQTWVKQADGTFHEHFGETRDDRLREFHEMNDTPVVGLWEAGLLRIEDKHIELTGAARIFRKGREPVDAISGSDLDELLAG
jgi:dipeptidase E